MNPETPPESVHEVKAALDARSGDAQAKQRRQTVLRTGIAVVAFVVLIVIVNALTQGDFFTAGNLTNVLRQITYNAILAVGQTFVIITAGIDLSVGSLIQLTGVVMAQFANASGLGGPLLVIVTTLVGIAVGCCAGLVNALAHLKRRRAGELIRIGAHDGSGFCHHHRAFREGGVPPGLEARRRSLNRRLKLLVGEFFERL